MGHPLHIGVAPGEARHALARVLALLYGAIAYLVFVLTAVYAVGFLANVAAPTSVDGPARVSTVAAVTGNLLLLGLFAVQHSVMARPWFKRWWTLLVPDPIERSTYVLASGIVLLLLFTLWQPLPATIWDVEAAAGRLALWVVYALGWTLVIWSTFMISHWDFLGLKQVWFHARSRAYRPPGFVTPWAYRLVRHPLMTGFFVAFWATPTMTAGHLLFAGAATAYILVAVRFEEHDLRAAEPEYAAYSERTPRFIPVTRRRAPRAE